LGSGVALVAGTWLLLSTPFLATDESGALRWRDLVVGAFIAALALARITGLLGRGWPSYVNAALGLWLPATAFLLADATAVRWNEAIVGGLWSCRPL
jgi:hypothetical protein